MEVETVIIGVRPHLHHIRRHNIGVGIFEIINRFIVRRQIPEMLEIFVTHDHIQTSVCLNVYHDIVNAARLQYLFLRHISAAVSDRDDIRYFGREDTGISMYLYRSGA